MNELYCGVILILDFQKKFLTLCLYKMRVIKKKIWWEYSYLLKWEIIFDFNFKWNKNKISNFFSNQLKEKTIEFIEELKDDDIYPW